VADIVEKSQFAPNLSISQPDDLALFPCCVRDVPRELKLLVIEFRQPFDAVEFLPFEPVDPRLRARYLLTKFR
jgi:hypothetical protein